MPAAGLGTLSPLRDLSCVALAPTASMMSCLVSALRKSSSKEVRMMSLAIPARSFR